MLIIFGGKKLPELAAGLGKGIREFKKATREPDEPPQPKPELNQPQTDTVETKKKEAAGQAAE